MGRQVFSPLDKNFFSDLQRDVRGLLSTGRERPAYTQATRWVESQIIPMVGFNFQ